MVYTWNFRPDLIDAARRHGVHGYLSKNPSRRRPGHRFRSRPHRADHHQQPTGPGPQRPGLEWPGRGEGLTDREAEILALITQGKNNADVATLTYLSPNTVKSYIRILYTTNAVPNGVAVDPAENKLFVGDFSGGPKQVALTASAP